MMRTRLPLTVRFTLVAAVATALVAIAISAVAFFAISADLENQVHQTITERASTVKQFAQTYKGHIPQGWVPSHSYEFGIPTYTQIITSDGEVWTPPNALSQLTPDASALSVAAGRKPAYYDTARINGHRAMVLTAPLGDHLAVQVAEPLTSTDQEVAKVGKTLATLSVIGVLVATLIGWAVAKTGLAPVARLAGVAEEVTLTGDPGRRVEVGRRQDELGRLATSFNAMLGALQRSLGAQRRLISDASHELRTPLTSLRINVDVLTANPDMPPDDRDEVLARVSDQVAELSRLVAGVTDLARGESPPAGRSLVALADVVTDVTEAARRDWPKAEFTAELDGSAVEGNAERLRVAVRNLLDNAAKFGPAEGPVLVRLSDGELTVRDHGPGIDPDDLPYVFDRFYRAPSSRSAPGSGLGLAVVREIATSHHGKVAAEPAPGGGTLVRLTLPVSTPDDHGQPSSTLGDHGQSPSHTGRP